jgi:putative aldouronate transport system substrate-binding protein
MKKHTLRGLLFVSLVLPAIAGIIGCGKTTEAAPSTPAVQVEFPGGWKPTADYSKRVTISTAMVMAIDGYDYNAGDPFAKWYSDHFNTNLEMVAGMTFENWSQRLRIWISSGDIPDVVLIDYRHPDVAGWIEQGLLKKFPDNWKQRWPNLAKVHAITGLGPQMEKVFGGTYFIARSRFDKNLPHDPVPNHPSFYFRKDWAEAVGFPVKTAYTVPEIIEYGRLIKQKDPGKLGNKLVPITGVPDYMVNIFVDRVSTHSRSYYKDKSGTYRWGPAAPETLKGLQYFYQAYASGALHPEFFALNFFDDYQQMFVSGVAGGIHIFAPAGQLQIAWNTFEQNVGLNPDECLAVATVLGDDGYYHQEDIINFWGVLAFRPDVSDEIFERYMDMMDFGCTETGFAMLNMGLEGIDWRREPDGSYTSLLPEGTQLQGEQGKYPSVSDAYALAQVKLYDDFSFEIPSIPQKHRDLSKALYKERCELSTPDTFSPTDWTLYCFDSPSIRKTMFDYATEYANIITAAKSEAEVETLWKKWIEANKSLVDPVLRELNSL